MEDALHIGELTLSLWHFDPKSLQAKDCRVALDNLALKILHAIHLQDVFGALFLNLICRFDRIVFKETMGAFKRFEDDVSEVGYSKQ